MKYLVKIGVVLLVVILPIGSWYYLQTGLNYRKAALDQLKPKGEFVADAIGGNAPFQSNTSLIQLEENSADHANKIYDQFGKAETFHLWSSNPEKKVDNWHAMSHEQQVELKKKYPSASYILLDTSVIVRNIYNEPSNKVIKELVSHIAIVLPRKKDKDIKMKNKR